MPFANPAFSRSHSVRAYGRYPTSFDDTDVPPMSPSKHALDSDVITTSASDTWNSDASPSSGSSIYDIPWIDRSPLDIVFDRTCFEALDEELLQHPERSFADLCWSLAVDDAPERSLTPRALRHPPPPSRDLRHPRSMPAVLDTRRARRRDFDDFSDEDDDDDNTNPAYSDDDELDKLNLDVPPTANAHLASHLMAKLDTLHTLHLHPSHMGNAYAVPSSRARDRESFIMLEPLSFEIRPEVAGAASIGAFPTRPRKQPKATTFSRRLFGYFGNASSKSLNLSNTRRGAAGRTRF